MDYFRKNLIAYIRANIVGYFFILLLFVSGVVFGALAVKTLPGEQKTELIGYLQIFFQGFSAWSAEAWNGTDLFVTVLFNHVKTLGLIWLLGFTVIGVPLVWFIVFTRGFVIGFTVGFLVNEYIMKGLAFALAAVLPHSLISVPAVVAAGVAATSFSLWLVRRRQHAKTTVAYEAIGYCGLCLGLFLVLLVASVIEVYISPLFMKLVVAMLFKQS
ncbi:MAG: stage II sporulation protein M [Sporomusaceae bacterium]|nr:stage II sporulation protein M [Sporomusaceae bacterium]